MSEASTEQFEETSNLTPQQRLKWEQQKAALRSQGIPLTRDLIRSVITAIKLGAPPTAMSPDTAGSRESRERVRTGTGIFDLLPEEHKDQPDRHLDRKYTELEKHILKLNAETTLAPGGVTGKEGYMSPPGKKLDIITMPEKEWAEYGWGREEKNATSRLLTEKLNMRGKQQLDRAMESLLLAGYTASEASAALQRFTPPPDQHLRPPWEVFSSVFADKDLPMSSLRIVFNEEMHDNPNVFLTKDPDSMEELAWQLSWTGDYGGLAGKWMQTRDGKPNTHAMFQARGTVVTDANGIKRIKGGKYYVSEHNFIEWFRDQTNRLYDIHGPNGQLNVMDVVKMEKGGFYHLTLRQMIEKGTLFLSEDAKTKYTQTWLQLQWEENMFSTLYNNDIIYRQASGMGMEEWIKQYEQMTLMNPLTKVGFRTNMLQRLLTGSLDYSEGRGDIFDAKYLSDNKLGGAFVEMVLAFYNLGDFQELERVLGKNSMLFTKAGWDKIIKYVAEDTATRPGGKVIMAPEAAKALEKAFEIGGGRVLSGSSKAARESQKAFIDFLNLCTTNLPGGYQEWFVSRGIKLAVAERYGLEDTAALGLTEAQAWFFNRFMGGMARNDVIVGDKPTPSVHDKMSELINMNANRLKYAFGEGKPYGNIQTIGKHLAAAVAPMLGIVTMQEVYVRDENGNIVKKKDGKPLMKRLSVLQVLEQLHNLRVKQHERVQEMKRIVDSTTDPQRKAQLEAQMKEEINRQNRRYMDIVGEDVAFRENAHREYTQVHLKPGHKWMERIMHGKGIDLNEYTNFDVFGGVTVNREKFIKNVQSDLIGTVRDMLKKYKWMNMNEDVRMPYYNPSTGKMEFRDGKLAQMLFGYDVLNCRAFWKTKNGRVVKRYGLPVIDFNKVEENRLQLMKQVFMTEIAADIYSHQLQNSGDPRFHNAYYLNFIDALDNVSGKLLVDEFAKHGIHVTENFLSKEDKKWLKARALNGRILWWDMGSFGFHVKWWITSLWDKTDKEGMGFGKMFSIIAKEAFSGGMTA